MLKEGATAKFYFVMFSTGSLILYSCGDSSDMHAQDKRPRTRKGYMI